MPQEIEVWYIIPGIRNKLAELMIKKGLKQKEVAQIMGTTEAAISQYLKGKRGRQLKFPKSMEKYFEKSCDNIIKDKSKSVSEILKLVNLAKKCHITCNLCKKYNKEILNFCCENPVKELIK